MASAAFGIGLRRESRAETRRRGDISKNSASQRLCGRINLMLLETPNPRVRRWEALDPQAGELRKAACQHAAAADGMNPVLSTHARAFFVSSCLRVRHSQLPDSRDRRTRRCFFITRSHEATKRSCWVRPPAVPRQARTGHSKLFTRGSGDTLLGGLPCHRPLWEWAWVGNRARRRGDAER